VARLRDRRERLKTDEHQISGYCKHVDKLYNAWRRASDFHLNGCGL
jgi:hypothetical protein